MAHFLTAAKQFTVNEDAPAIVEYALMIAFITIACFAAIATLGLTFSDFFAQVSQTVEGISTTP